MTLRITEIFYSLQGETRTAGLPTVFVRLTGCPLRCQYCDTAYAFQGGQSMSLPDILAQVAQYMPVAPGIRPPWMAEVSKMQEHFFDLPLAALVHPCTAEGRATQEQLPGDILQELSKFSHLRSRLETRISRFARNDIFFSNVGWV